VSLLAQVAGGVVGLAALSFASARLAARRPRWSSVLSAGAIAGVLAAGALVAVYVSTGRGFNYAWKQYAALQPGQAATAGGAVADVNVEFVEWARDRLGPGETFYLVPDGPSGDAAAYQWTTYRLLPSLAVDRPELADVLVFYDERPDGADYDRGAFERPRTYEPGYAVARRIDGA